MIVQQYNNCYSIHNKPSNVIITLKMTLNNNDGGGGGNNNNSGASSMVRIIYFMLILQNSIQCNAMQIIILFVCVCVLFGCLIFMHACMAISNYRKTRSTHILIIIHRTYCTYLIIILFDPISAYPTPIIPTILTHFNSFTVRNQGAHEQGVRSRKI